MLESSTALSQFHDPEFQAELRKIVDHRMSARAFLNLLAELNEGKQECHLYITELTEIRQSLKVTAASTTDAMVKSRVGAAVVDLNEIIGKMINE
jgi:hypothetical protein